MRIMAVLAVAAMIGGIARADEMGRATEPVVTVCMELGYDVLTLTQAQQMASKMFEGVGVKIDWRYPRACPADHITITLSYQTPETQLPKAWAYAAPYEGTHIVVFYDRVQRKMAPAPVPILLAHVLVHEITHILEGIVWHSETGVMKARWTIHDQRQMASKPLPFAPEDVRLIRRGLEARQSRLNAQGSGLQSGTLVALQTLNKQ